MSSTLATAFTRLVGVRLPVVQTGMGWVSGASLTAATSAAGGFGILAATTLDRAALNDALKRVSARTSEPFGVNVRPDQPDLAGRIDDALGAGVRVVSFAGAPSAATVRSLHEAGAVVMVTVGARRHAEKMLDMGADVLLVQGSEGGGHTGQVPTSILLPDVLDLARDAVPVLAAGGFKDGRGLAAALAAGAHGVAMGTRFLLTADSRVPDAVKARYLAAGPTDTVVTTALDGAPQRVLSTPFVERLSASARWRRLPGALGAASAFKRTSGESWLELAREGWEMRRNQDRSWTQVALAAYTPTLTRAALVDGRLDAGVLPTGQVVGTIDDLPSVAELLATMERDAIRHLTSNDPTTRSTIVPTEATS